MATWTIKALLDWMTPFLADKQVDAPRLCSELLLTHVLGLRRIELYTQFDRILSPDELASLRSLVNRAGAHEPVGYLVGKSEFYSIEFDVQPGCLIPRPETELLVQHAIEAIRDHSDGPQVLDLCTGSGCIAVALAKNCHRVHVTATDISPEAIAIARANIHKHCLSERIELLQGDLLAPLAQRRFDLVVSNPPYVSTSEFERLDRNVKDYEPELALRAGAEGLDVYRRILQNIGDHLRPEGVLMMEMGFQQGTALCQLIEQTGLFQEIAVKKDFEGHDRLVLAKTESS
ncbi:MAG: peptide chain release factor N(5)-glutamine methyltransferase [Planctomycetes bacterium]|nr:peptide chain release factor N(5)-glutamine methyltransferase [Planctomycetota bacterium]